ncbi:MAG: hypothetical protein ACK59B_07670, partial [Alphaproteobacteria bacterium]
TPRRPPPDAHLPGCAHLAANVTPCGAAVLTIYPGVSSAQANLAHVSQEDARDRQRRHAEAGHST